MNHEDFAKTFINSLMPAGMKPFMWGPPGVGKTALARQIAQILTQLTREKWKTVIWDMTVLYDPADSRGIPTVQILPDGRKVTVWVTPSHMVMGDENVIVLLDDLPTLPQSSQAACMRLLQFGEIGDTKFGPNVHFMGAGNRMGDSSATNNQPFALANRFWHCNLTFDLNGWANWAMANNVPLELICYHRFTRGENLYPIYNDSESTPQPCGLCKGSVAPNAICSHCVKRSRALPTLRTWSDGVGKLLLTNPDRRLEMEIYAGSVGKEKAAEFCGYLKLYREIPSMDSILLGPSAAPIPKAPSVLYFVAMALARMASTTNIDAVIQYLDRLPQQEFAAVCLKDAKRRTPDVEFTRAFQSWAIKHQGLMN